MNAPIIKHNSGLLPASNSARLMLLIAALSLGFCYWSQFPMWMVQLGFRQVSAGGGEYLIALLWGLPSLLLGALLALVLVSVPRWRCVASSVVLLLAVLPLPGLLWQFI